MKVSKLAVNYATLIRDGYYEFDDVHKRYKADTAIVLCLWECEDLVTDADYLEKAQTKIAEHKAKN